MPRPGRPAPGQTHSSSSSCHLHSLLGVSPARWDMSFGERRTQRGSSSTGSSIFTTSDAARPWDSSVRLKLCLANSQIVSGQPKPHFPASSVAFPPPGGPLHRQSSVPTFPCPQNRAGPQLSGAGGCVGAAAAVPRPDQPGSGPGICD